MYIAFRGRTTLYKVRSEEINNFFPGGTLPAFLLLVLSALKATKLTIGEIKVLSSAV